MILQAQPVGPACSTKYIVRNLKNNKYWSGQRFVVNSHLAALYATVNDACLAMRDIQISQYGHLPRRRYRVPVEIEVYGDAPEETIVSWLKVATEYNLQTELYGNGPDGNLVLPAIHYGLLQEIGDDEPLSPPDDELERLLDEEERKRKRND